jgi:hypothetical protein
MPKKSLKAERIVVLLRPIEVFMPVGKSRYRDSCYGRRRDECLNGQINQSHRAFKQPKPFSIRTLLVRLSPRTGVDLSDACHKTFDQPTLPCCLTH